MSLIQVGNETHTSRFPVLIFIYEFQIYTWGARAYGNLGRKPVEIFSVYDDPFTGYLTAGRVEGILESSKAVKIACGAYFSVAVLHDKRVRRQRKLHFSFCVL